MSHHSLCTSDFKKIMIVIPRTRMFLSSNSRFSLKAIREKGCILHPDITCAKVRSAMRKENDLSLAICCISAAHCNSICLLDIRYLTMLLYFNK